MATPNPILTDSSSNVTWTTGATFWAIALVASAFFVGLYAVAGVGLATQPIVLWLCVVIFLVGAMALVGHALTGYFSGVLITENNVMSASRAQAVLWFIAIVSSYVVLWILNFQKSPADSVSLTEGTLLATVAASGSLVGAQLLNAPKAGKDLDDDKLKARVKDLKDGKATRQGALWKNFSPGGAKLRDIFEGDEVVDGGSLDAGKVQMLVLTFVLVCLYVLKLLSGLEVENPPDAVPEIDTTIASLLGLSHAGYLGNKLPMRTTQG